MVSIRRIQILLWVVISMVAAEIVFVIWCGPFSFEVVSASGRRHVKAMGERVATLWSSPDPSAIPPGDAGELVRYGRALIEHTAIYLGPKGKVAQVSNGMNCQNCHLEAGTRPFGANYSAVASTYPKFRQRSGTVEGFEKRVNDCFERSMNGQRLPHGSREMKAIIAYIKWLGKDVPRGTTPSGAGLLQIPLLKRSADPSKGKQGYNNYCSRCHGDNGEGLRKADGAEWEYPPLWGEESYNTGAGLFLISKFAAFIKANMPYGATYNNMTLSTEDAWDIAAFVNSMPRPHREFPADWPELAHKPMDYPFGPYDDNFPEATHKYGPFSQIIAAKKK